MVFRGGDSTPASLSPSGSGAMGSTGVTVQPAYSSIQGGGCTAGAEIPKSVRVPKKYMSGSSFFIPNGCQGNRVIIWFSADHCSILSLRPCVSRAPLRRSGRRRTNGRLPVCSGFLGVLMPTVSSPALPETSRAPRRFIRAGGPGGRYRPRETGSWITRPVLLKRRFFPFHHPPVRSGA